MRALSVAVVLTVLGLAAGTTLAIQLTVGATLALQLAANAPSRADGFRAPSIMMQRLTANAKDLSARAFDAF